MPTKRKPRWLDLRWLAAGLCALLLAVPSGAATRAAQPAKPKAVKAKQSPVKAATSPRPRAMRTVTALHSPVRGDNGSFFGAASFYGYGFQGRLVANGERFDVRGMTAACNHVPLGTWVAVRREDDGRCIVVRVNDRMHVKHKVRVIDLSRGAAEKLRMITAGVVMVRVAPLPGPPEGDTQTVCERVFVAESVRQCDDCEGSRPVLLPEISEAAESGTQPPPGSEPSVTP